ncbi:sodium-independent sulfate anion transporter-like [Uranotaenia lowii]|uniref:sodium-independent sulfate anion transporter-like n=1 Tax=Uranotaenia lowii TaxID=190385 RepID=UPI0024799DC9|nr:sodium-independent sulfate anion transporter-like [Uranotaenia lowii]
MVIAADVVGRSGKRFRKLAVDTCCDPGRLVKNVKRRVHILNWITSYGSRDLVEDFIAGVTVGLTIIPQSLAYAPLAGLPPQYGLYAAYMGALVYIIFGSVKEVSVGPTSLMALLIVQYTTDKPMEYAILLAFLVGIVELLMGIFKLGFLVSFIPIPVTSAFTSATSIIIIGTQLKNLFGIPTKGNGFFTTVYRIATNLSETNVADLLLGLFGCAFLLSIQQVTKIQINTETPRGKFLKKFLWYLSLSRNALIVLISSVLAYIWHSNGSSVPFKLSGKVTPGIPGFEFPIYDVHNGNETIPYWQVVRELGSSIILTPMVAILANVSIAKAFTTGKIVDASQEMIALGLCNIVGSFFSAMPTCGAFTRSAVSHSSGVRTPLAGLYSASMVLLSLSLLTPYFYFIPKTTLGAVLICSVMFMIDLKIAKTFWKASKIDGMCWTGCFLCSLFAGVEVGLLFGIFIGILGLLKVWVRPMIQQESVSREELRYLKYRPEVGLFFPAVDYLRTEIVASAIEQPLPIVLDCSAIFGLDHTSSKGLEELRKELDRMELKLILLNLRDDLKLKLEALNTDCQLIFWKNEDEAANARDLVISIRK